MALGMHGILTAENARDKAFAMMAEIKSGADPVQDKIEKWKEPVVRDLSERFLKEHVDAIRLLRLFLPL